MMNMPLEEELKESKSIIERMEKQRSEMEKNQFKKENDVDDMKEQMSKKSAKTHFLNATLESEGKKLKDHQFQIKQLKVTMVESNELIDEKEAAIEKLKRHHESDLMVKEAALK